jgi:hypothetical protein
MMAQVDPILQMVTSCQAIVLYLQYQVILLIVSLKLVIVELFLFTHEALNMFRASVDHIHAMVCEHVFGCVFTMLQGGI